MQIIPTLFNRDPENRAFVLPTVNPLCGWVLAGEGRATRMWNGVAVRLDDAGRWWARRELTSGAPAPAGFVLVDADAVTGRSVGWEPAEWSPYGSLLAQAVVNCGGVDGPAATHELLGPEINGDPDDFGCLLLMPHGWAPLSQRIDIETAPRSFVGLGGWLAARPYEGIVFHHDDGRMAKIKARDFPGPAGAAPAERPEQAARR